MRSLQELAGELREMHHTAASRVARELLEGLCERYRDRLVSCSAPELQHLQSCHQQCAELLALLKGEPHRHGEL
jgi:hypothetical protein